MEVTIKELVPELKQTIRRRLVPMVHSSPGIGKSAIAKQIAAEYSLKLIDLRLSQSDPTDLSGFPKIDTTIGKASYCPMETFPIEGDAIPVGCNGWLILLDELPSARPAVQAAAYKLILDREVGQHKLHKNVAIMAAGNLSTDNAIVHSMGTALQSRMVHYELVVALEPWVEWARENNIDHRVISYLQFRPEMLHKFSPDHNDKTFPCPRTWHFLSDLISANPKNNIEAREIKTGDRGLTASLSGAIGEGGAREFINFCQIYHELPTIEEIINAPETVRYTSSASINYALTGLVAEHMSDKHIEPLMTFTERLPTEFQVIALQNIYAKTPTITRHPRIRSWITQNAADFM